jgi:alpha-L-arabinofuranosidase
MPVLDVAGTTDGTTVHLSFVNRSPVEEVLVRLAGVSGVARRTVLHHDDAGAKNTPDAPTRVTPTVDQVELEGQLLLPPHSHVTVVFTG